MHRIRNLPYKPLNNGFQNQKGVPQFMEKPKKTLKLTKTFASKKENPQGINLKFNLLKTALTNNTKKVFKKKTKEVPIKDEEQMRILEIEKANLHNPQYLVEYSGEVFEYLKDQEVS